MIHRDNIMLATLQPAHRPLQLVCQECCYNLFTTEAGLAAEGPSDMRNGDGDVCRRNMQRHRQLLASEPDRLAGDPDREGSVGVPFGNDAARLHRHQGQTRLPQVERDDLIGLGKPCLDIAHRLLSGHGNIALLIEDLRAILSERSIESSDRG